MLTQPARHIVGATEHRHFVAALHQSSAELLDVVLDAAEGGRNTALTDHCYSSDATTLGRRRPLYTDRRVSADRSVDRALSASPGRVDRAATDHRVVPPAPSGPRGWRRRPGQ